MFVDCVDRLGRDVAQRWLRRSGKSDFAKIAFTSLIDARLHEHFSLTQIINWVGKSRQFPPQYGVANFGEPAITLFVGEGFYIELYFWLRPNISIHDHGFTGAFTVLLGSSLHIRYNFENKSAHGNAQCGMLHALDPQELEPGDVCLIPSGIRMIHQVWHLEKPTVSLVVRTEGITTDEPQRTYFLPGLAVTSSHYGDRSVQRSGMLRYLAQTGGLHDKELLMGLLSEEDASATFYTILELDRITDSDFPASAQEFLLASFGGVGEIMLRAIEIERLARIFNFTRITDMQERLLVALLLSGLERDQIIATIRGHCNENSIRQRIAHWLRSVVEVLGESSNEQDYVVEIFALAIEGMSYSEIRSTITDMFQLDGPHKFESLYDEVAASPVLNRVLPGKPIMIP